MCWENGYFYLKYRDFVIGTKPGTGNPIWVVLCMCSLIIHSVISFDITRLLLHGDQRNYEGIIVWRTWWRCPDMNLCLWSSWLGLASSVSPFHSVEVDHNGKNVLSITLYVCYEVLIIGLLFYNEIALFSCCFLHYVMYCFFFGPSCRFINLICFVIIPWF